MGESMAGKRALITGGSSGVGAAIAQALARKGVKVAINYAANRDRASATLSSLEGSGHVVVQGDALKKDGIRGIVEDTRNSLGGIDMVVSNVGWTAFAPFNELSALEDSDWLRCYESNVMSHLWLIQACRDELKANQGAMVITASVAGLKPSGSSMAYSVSKSATIHLAKSLAIACAPDIRVNSVAAGVLLTDWSKGFSPEHIQNLEQANALKSLARVEDVAQVYVTLLENRSMTGQCVEVSAGFRM